MRKIREILRLSAQGLSCRQVGLATGLPRTTVSDQLARARRAGLDWPLPDELDDEVLEQRLYGRPVPPLAVHARPLPEWAEIHRELRRPGVTLALLHLEYRARHPDGYGYSQFCDRYRHWAGRLDLVMRQEHRAGEKLFIDYPGQTIPIVDPETGEIWGAQLFVAVLGASNYTYAEAFPSQELPYWIAGHVHTFEFFGGCVQILVPDNLRSAVSRAHRYDPDPNRTYDEMAAHYGCAVIPARPHKPRDKAKVENAALRKQVFCSLAEANVAIRERLDWLNHRPFRKLPGCRASLFETLDRPALRPLPAQPYEYATWKSAKVNIDYHVELERHYYSVPCALVGQSCDLRASAGTLEIFFHGRRVASHRRSSEPGRFSTDPAHMPESHRRHLEWTPSRIVAWAAQTGPATAALVDAILASRRHPEQGYRTCLGILRLGQHYGDERLEAAATRSLAGGGRSYRSVESILKTGLDRQPLPEPESAGPIRRHANLRGAGYYE